MNTEIKVGDVWKRKDGGSEVRIRLYGSANGLVIYERLDCPNCLLSLHRPEFLELHKRVPSVCDELVELREENKRLRYLIFKHHEVRTIAWGEDCPVCAQEKKEMKK